MTLDQFIEDELERVKLFQQWYTLMNAHNPEEFPLKFDKDNAGLWDEALSEYSIFDEVYTVKE